MRKLAFLVWLLMPVVAGAYHYGPGQQRLLLDDAAALVDKAEEAIRNEDHELAAESYDQALQLLPAEEQIAARRLRLERDKAWMQAKKLPEAHSDLTQLLDEVSADDLADPAFVRDVRATLANSQYYMTWLMRLEGRPREDWEPVIEASRQSFRVLAETDDASCSTQQLKDYSEDLEASIRLARLDLKDLQGLPLPSQ